jgi:hypothetical protein
MGKWQQEGKNTKSKRVGTLSNWKEEVSQRKSPGTVVGVA